MKTAFEVRGLRELEDALLQLPRATARNVLRRTLIEVAEPIRAEAERLAPRESGKLAQNMLAAFRAKGQTNAARDGLRIFIGPDSRPQGSLQEFGTSRHPAQPFLRPAWDRGWRDALDAIATALGAQITRAAQRQARKAARAAAKGR